MSNQKSPTVFGNDIFAHYARQLIIEFDKQLEQHAPSRAIPPSPPATQATTPEISELSASVVDPEFSEEFQRLDVATLTGSQDKELPKRPVGILGAGASGLYTAMILQDLGIPYKLLEARDRVGGRLYTHTFPNEIGQPYNYFDVGAMRFPKFSSMGRVFHLFDEHGPLQGELNKDVKPFIFQSGDALLSYNGQRMKQNAVTSQAMHPSFLSNIPQEYLDIGPEDIINDVITQFTTGLLTDLTNNSTDGWDLMRQYDHYSTRAYMTLEYIPSAALQQRGMPAKHLPTQVVNWCETFDKLTGLYDRALSETVLMAVAFGWQPPAATPAQSTPVKWFRIEGGAQKIAGCMARHIAPDAIILGNKVTAIALKEVNVDKFMEVTTNYHEKFEFAHVITTIPLPVMRTIDLTQAELSPRQSDALRQLNYGPSIKVGMQFREAWWTFAEAKDGTPLNIKGGQTYTDSPLRTVVYPSYGIADNPVDRASTTLIASYSWTEDAERMAALIANDKQALIELVIRELSNIHNIEIQFLTGQLVDTFAWSWSQDPYTMGAFIFFGPGKFGDVYTSLTIPAAKGLLHFAGEATSVRHAWVEGALDSAWRAVEELLLQPEYRDNEELRNRFHKNWGVNVEWSRRDKQHWGGLSEHLKAMASLPSRFFGITSQAQA